MGIKCLLHWSTICLCISYSCLMSKPKNFKDITNIKTKMSISYLETFDADYPIKNPQGSTNWGFRYFAPFGLNNTLPRLKVL